MCLFGVGLLLIGRLIDRLILTALNDPGTIKEHGSCMEKILRKEKQKRFAVIFSLRSEKVDVAQIKTSAIRWRISRRHSLPFFLPPPPSVSLALARISSEFGKEVCTGAVVGTVDEQRARIIADVLVARLRGVLGRRPVRFPGLRLGWPGVLARADEVGKEICACAVVGTVDEKGAGIIADVLVTRLRGVSGRRPVRFPGLRLGYHGGAGGHAC